MDKSDNGGPSRDWREPPSPDEEQTLMHNVRDRSPLWPLAVGLVVFAIGVAFGESYPFVISGDGHGYFQMIERGRSATLYQSGYPLAFMWTKPLANLLGLPLQDVLRFSHYAFTAAVASLFVAAMARLISTWGAVACAAVIFLNQPLWVYVHTTRAEWFVGVLGVAMLSLSAFYVSQPQPGRRVILALAMGVVLAIGYVAKVNFIGFAAVVMPLLVWEWSRRAPSPGRRIAASIAASAVGFIAVYVPFMAAFHQPSVNDNSWFKLTYQQGWGLMVHLGAWQGTLLADNGLRSARVVWLNQALPEHAKLDGRDYADIGRARREAGNRATPEQAAMIAAAMRADHAGLLEIIDASGLSRELPISAWPIAVIFTTDHYLGLPAGEDMMVGAFIEAVKAEPGSFVASVWTGVKQFLTLRGMPHPPIAKPKTRMGEVCGPLPPTGADYGPEQIAPCVDHDAPVIRITALMTPGPTTLAAAMAIAAGVLFLSLFLRGQTELKTINWVAGACILAQAVFAALILGRPRIKETFTVYPVILAFVALAAALAILLGRGALRRPAVSPGAPAG
jgi:hypothetical protein